MTDDEEMLRVAVGLARRAVQMLESAGRTATAEQIAVMIDELLRDTPALRDREMTPEQACLVAGIPLTPPLEAAKEVDLPADVAHACRITISSLSGRAGRALPGNDPILAFPDRAGWVESSRDT